MYKRINELLGTDFKCDSDIDWGYLSSYKLSENFIKEFKNKVYWNIISIHQKLSESFIREFEDKVDWSNISFNQNLSEPFIREFKDKVNWKGISANQILSENFIREFEDKVFWCSISANQILSENFIREFKDKIDWIYIVFSQLLSWSFILEFKNKVDWTYISRYQPFIDPDYEKIDKKILKENKLYHLYWETKNRGWFVGYVRKKDKVFSFSPNPYNIKSKVYWKDLIMRTKVKSFEPIRRIKYV